MKVNYFNEKDIKKVNFLLRTLHQQHMQNWGLFVYASVNEVFIVILCD